MLKEILKSSLPRGISRSKCSALCYSTKPQVLFFYLRVVVCLTPVFQWHLPIKETNLVVVENRRNGVLK